MGNNLHIIMIVLIVLNSIIKLDQRLNLKLLEVQITMCRIILNVKNQKFNQERVRQQLNIRVVWSSV